MGTITRGAKAGGGTNFNSGQTIDPAEPNTDLNTIVTEINGLLDDANVETGTLPGAKSLRFTEISAPSSPSSNDILLYGADDGAGVTKLITKDSAGAVKTLVNADSLGNVGVGTETYGTSAQKVLAQFIGVAPTTAPVDAVQEWVIDRNGAGTASKYVRTEDNGITEGVLAVLIQAYDGTERTTTSTSTVTLSTLVTNIPAGDAFIVTGLVRKTNSNASTAKLGLKINGVQIITDFSVTTANAATEFGSFAYGVGDANFGQGRDTNYTQGSGLFARTGTAGGTVTWYPTTSSYVAQLPTAAITEVIISGSVASASNTLAIKHVTVYRVARV